MPVVIPALRAAAGLAGASAAFALAACADAGLPPAPAYAEWSGAWLLHPPAAERVLVPRPTSPEFLRSWGLSLVDAEPAYRLGYTGAGVTIALIDTGLEGAPMEVTGRLSAASTDVVAGRGGAHPGDGRPEERHGGDVAAELLAALDGRGVVGLAYRSTLLSVRADAEGSCRTECAFDTAVLARGIDYAVAHGASIVMLAVQGRHRLQPAFEAALERAAEAGAVVVASAGNDAGPEPSWPARYAADPRFERAVVAVGAAGADGRLIGWSNRAGRAAERYLTAPGGRVVTRCGETTCALVSGTSVSVPYVAGAIALAMEADPRLGAQDAARLVLLAGRRTPDAVDGRGLLDVGAAVDLARREAKTARSRSASLR